MAFTWVFVLVALMTGSPNEREPKRAKSEKDQTGTSQQDSEIPASPELEKSTDWKTICDEDEDDDEVEGDADQEEQPVHPPVREYTGGRRARSRGEHFTESLISPQSGHLVPLRFEEMTAPTRPSIIHEGESSQHTPTLSSVHREQQRLIADLAELDADVMELTTILSESTKELQSINKMVRKIFLKLGCTVSDDSDSD